MSQVFTISIEQTGLHSFTGRVKEMGDIVLVQGKDLKEVYYQVSFQLGAIIQDSPYLRRIKIHQEIRLLARLYQV